jgi:hypothetical protein
MVEASRLVPACSPSALWIPATPIPCQAMTDFRQTLYVAIGLRHDQSWPSAQEVVVGFQALVLRAKLTWHSS